MIIKFLLIPLLCLCVCKKDAKPVDTSSEPSEWTLSKVDDRTLFKHISIKNCYIGLNSEPMGYEDNEWTISEELKDIGPIKYCISRIELKSKLWCYTYTRIENGLTSQASVYMTDSCNECLEAVEKLLKRFQK